ncbi:MAG: OmpA family protein, partial [Spirochaetaceae bacterium]|nr:OmpA family protein [Spirochaetaceae bacterium]
MKMRLKRVLAAFFFCVLIFSKGAQTAAAKEDAGVKYISPNNDGVQDDLIVNFNIKDKRYITEWRLLILDENGYLVNTVSNKEDRPQVIDFFSFWKALFTPKRSVLIPPSVRWDGRNSLGETVADGVYTYYITAKNDNGFTGESQKHIVAVDCTPPDITLSQPSEDEKFFGAGTKSRLIIKQDGAASNSTSDSWMGVFIDAQGRECRTFRWSGNPAPVVWDGLSDSGAPVPDGVYYYTVSGVDLSGNRSLPSRVNNIIFSGDKPQTNIAISGSRYFSNNPQSSLKSVTLLVSASAPASGNTLKSWKIEVLNSGGIGKVIKSWSGGEDGEKLPSKIVFSGVDENGVPFPDDSYAARFSASYRNGYNAPVTPSPLFFLKSSPPQAEVSILEPKNGVFSPGNGEGRDVIIFSERLEAPGVSWNAEIRNADGVVLRTFERGGGGSSFNVWDGFDENGFLCPDGDYIYSLFSIDMAGNASSVPEVNFSIDTQKTSLMLRAAAAAFSPNGDGVQDSIAITPVIKSSGVEAYDLEIRSVEGVLVKKYSGNGEPPKTIEWDGYDGEGRLCADNRYAAHIAVVSRNSGMAKTASTQTFLLKTKGPYSSVSAPPYATAFSPDGDGRKDFLPIQIQTSSESEWKAEIRRENDGAVVWRKTWYNTNVPSFDWDGTDESGNIVQDGKYAFTLSSNDGAGNTAHSVLSPITVDKRPVSAALTASFVYFSPNGKNKTQKFKLFVPLKEGVQSWDFAIYSSAGGTPVKRLLGNDSPAPENFEWDGLLADGSAAEGSFYASVNIVYWKGNLAAAESGSFTCSGSPPVISANVAPEFFSPDEDGVDDELIINLKAESVLPLSSWSFTVYDYSPSSSGKGKPFWSISGKSQVTSRAIWNGRSSSGASAKSGELVQSATDYPYDFTVTDVEGQSATASGFITVDVLVIRDGDFLRIQVPAITFRGNAADFDGLSKEVMTRNDWILGRITRALNRFKEYTVLIEGHANPVLGTAGEEAELLDLSTARAVFVKQQLVRQGISASRLSAKGVGASRLIPGVSPRDAA